MPDNRVSGGTEENSSKSSTTMRRNYNQVDFPFFSDADDFRRRLSMHHQLFNFQPGTFFALSQLWKFPFGGVFELFSDVCDRKRLSHSGITNRRNNGLNNIHADNGGLKCTRERGRVVQRVISAFAEIGRQQYCANLHSSYFEL